MRDKQIGVKPSLAGIPVISPILHCLAMPAIVFFRSFYGYAFLSPKSVFLASSWASVLFFIYACKEEGAWAHYGAIASFCLGASVLYLLHLLLAVIREIRKKGCHDFYSGISHLFRLPSLREKYDLETPMQLWFEPGCVIFVAIAVRLFFSERILSNCLLVVGAALWCKEFINYWAVLRYQKKQKDVMREAEDSLNEHVSAPASAAPSGIGRKPRKIIPRAVAASASEERRHAERLRLMPPYALEQAEENYRTLIKDIHPDANEQSPESNRDTAELNEAIEFFREKLNA